MTERDARTVPAPTGRLPQHAEVDLQSGEEHQIGEAEQGEEVQPLVVVRDDAEQRLAEDDADEDFADHRRHQPAGQSPGDERDDDSENADEQQRGDVNRFLHQRPP